jgi:ABC-type branched-subunit amino acid transport system ATPase component
MSAMEVRSMLTLDALNCGYGAVRAVHDLSLDLPAGTLLALLGPNGAGKTSTIMAIMGHIDIYSGRIVYDGADITRRRAVDRAELGIALVPEGRQLFPDLTVDENLTVGGYAHARARQSRACISRLPAACRTHDAAREFALRRRAADARHRSRPDGGAAVVVGG